MRKADLNAYIEALHRCEEVNLYIKDSDGLFFRAVWENERMVVISVSVFDSLLDKKDEEDKVEKITGASWDGDYLVSVPWKWIDGICTDEEMGNILACIDVDERLLAYARG